MVDCSHANSLKQHRMQEDVARTVISQRADGNKALIGLMLESYLEEGNQPVPENRAELKYGVSITDACLSFSETVPVLETLAKAVATRRASH